MKLLKKLLLIIFSIVIVAVVIVTILGYNQYKEAITEMPLEKKIATIEGDKNYETIDKMPQVYLDAVVSVEDHRFFEHGPIDIISIGRAILTNIKKMELAEGGSTITQQLAKNTYFSQSKKITRKVAEIFMAYNMEKNYDKNKILELYVNTSYFGDGYTGIKEACNGYYKKEPINMTLYEATLLAGVPNAPSVYAPTKNLRLAEERQKQVIYSMIDNGKITTEEASSILQE